jgi:hypothetical protein
VPDLRRSTAVAGACASATAATSPGGRCAGTAARPRRPPPAAPLPWPWVYDDGPWAAHHVRALETRPCAGAPIEAAAQATRELIVAHGCAFGGDSAGIVRVPTLGVAGIGSGRLTRRDKGDGKEQRNGADGPARSEEAHLAQHPCAHRGDLSLSSSEPRTDDTRTITANQRHGNHALPMPSDT